MSVPADVLCMGNVDPAAIIAEGTPKTVAKATKELIQKCGK